MPTRMTAAKYHCRHISNWIGLQNCEKAYNAGFAKGMKGRGKRKAKRKVSRKSRKKSGKSKRKCKCVKWRCK